MAGRSSRNRVNVYGVWTGAFYGYVVSYRPICDTWILARSKVKYYGSYPGGFLHRARALLGVGPDGAVLHVCGGMVKQYPYRGFGINDKTLDLDPACEPDFLQDCRDPLPLRRFADVNDDGIDWNGEVPWDAVLIDRPYTQDDAAHYTPGAEGLPNLNALLKGALDVVPIGHRVGVLDYLVPHPGKRASFVALVAVSTGFNNRIRAYSVFERIA